MTSNNITSESETNTSISTFTFLCSGSDNCFYSTFISNWFISQTGTIPNYKSFPSPGLLRLFPENLGIIQIEETKEQNSFERNTNRPHSRPNLMQHEDH
ncbi:hypothetical protein HWI79_3410 [Cryptosporidium felis]|nr:hypothetical protein HWI79_3410 [Cryptosporidium felis]